MIEPKSLSDLIALDPVFAFQTAVCETLKTLFPDIDVKRHPGKLDVFDVIEGETISAPSMLIGWSAIKTPRDVTGAYELPIDFAAYIVAEDYADREQKRSIDRQQVAFAIGSRLLDILQDPDLQCFGQSKVLPPATKPEPTLRPLFTATAHGKGTAYYAVTWQQTLVGLGPDFLGGPTPQIVSHEDPEGPGLSFGSDDAIPPEIATLIAEDSE